MCAEDAPGIVVLRISGTLDCASVADIRRTMDAVVAQGYRKIVVDLSTLRIIDAAGVGAIVALYHRVSAERGWVMVSGARDQPLAIFRLLKFDKVFFTARAEARA